MNENSNNEDQEIQYRVIELVNNSSAKSRGKLIYLILPLWIVVGSILVGIRYDNWRNTIKFIKPYRSLRPATNSITEDIESANKRYVKLGGEFYDVEPEALRKKRAWYTSADLSRWEIARLERLCSNPDRILREDPYLVHLLLQSKRFHEDDLPYIFNRYQVFKEQLYDRLYNEISGNKKKELKIESERLKEKLYNSIPELIEYQQYVLYNDIAMELGDKSHLLKSSLYLGDWERALKHASDLKYNRSGTHEMSPSDKFNCALAYLLSSEVRTAYNAYKHLLEAALSDRRYSACIEDSEADIHHFISYSDYEFDRSFAAAILDLHGYYASLIDERRDFNSFWLRIFLNTYDRRNEVLCEIAEELDSLHKARAR